MRYVRIDVKISAVICGENTENIKVYKLEKRGVKLGKGCKSKNKTAQKQNKRSKNSGEDKNQEKTKEQKINSEKIRLTKIYQDIEQKRRLTVKGLIERAAYMRITLEELEEDINENGITELFQQGNQDPYDRKRPVADFYVQINNSYQKIIKQLTDLLPKEEPQERTANKEGDKFNEFVINRG